jgi:hypothetical protein
MNATVRSTKRLGIAIALVAAAVIWTGWSQSRVLAVQDPEYMPPPFGLAQGQTARINVFNNGEQGGIINYSFIDSQGRALAQSERVMVPPGHIVSFDLDGDSIDLVRDRFGRIEMRAVVTALGGPDTKNLRVSLEVFDNATGVTSFIVIPPPDPE